MWDIGSLDDICFSEQSVCSAEKIYIIQLAVSDIDFSSKAYLTVQNMINDKNYKTIGLILEESFTDYPKDVTHSVVHSVMNRKDIRLVLITGRQDDSTDGGGSAHLYKRMYNSIYRINSQCHFDGLLVAIPNLLGREELFRRGKSLFNNIPRVFITLDDPDEITVNYDNRMGVVEALDYLVRIKGYTKICMLGGRDDNQDAVARKEAFCSYLAEAGLVFNEDMYEKTDMNVNTRAAAARLLERNPDAQAIFCVNDQSAEGLYDAMAAKGLIPGKDIMVFGFDNAARAGQMLPPLSSIGAAGTTLGQKALEILLDMINGQEVSSVRIPTRLYGRESFEYESYEVSTRDILRADSTFIYSFFDDCFYRYGTEIVDPGDIDLRRLFYEIVSGMMFAAKNRYIDDKQVTRIRHLIDIFFENGAMRYTDAAKFVRSISKLQGSMNEIQGNGYSNSDNNRLFSYIRDKAIQALALARSAEGKKYYTVREMNFDFMISTVNYGTHGEAGLENVIRNLGKVGFDNAALYLFDKPTEYTGAVTDKIPPEVNLRCVLKEREIFEIPADRRRCRVDEIFSRRELPLETMGYTSYPLFHGRFLLGILVTGISRKIMDSGGYLAFLLGKAIFENSPEIQGKTADAI